jgi:hypothetical protein
MFTKRQALILQLLQKSKPRERVSILQGVDNKMIRLISEMALNTLQGNIRLSPKQRKHLQRYKQILRSLADKRTRVGEKRRIIIRQKGGFLPILLPIIANAVGGLLGSLWKRE